MKSLSDLIKWESSNSTVSVIETLRSTLSSIIGPKMDSAGVGSGVVFFENLLSKEVADCDKEYKKLQSLIGTDSANLVKAMHYGALKIDSTEMNSGSESGSPQYHNKEHFACALASACVLSNSEFEVSQYHLKLLTCGAMLFHDLGHDGGTNSIVPGSEKTGGKAIHLEAPQSQRLERVAIKECSEFLAAAGVSKKDREIIEQCILNTDPALTIANRKKYNELRSVCENFDESNKDQVVSRLSAVCNDADVTFSLLPKSGLELGRSLAQEWEKIEHPQAKAVGSFEGRLGFLKFFSPMSEGAKKVGLLDVVGSQLEVFSTIGQRVKDKNEFCDIAGDVAGAKFLDDGPFNLSKNTFIKCLIRTNVEPGVLGQKDAFAANDKQHLAMG